MIHNRFPSSTTISFPIHTSPGLLHAALPPAFQPPTWRSKFHSYHAGDTIVSREQSTVMATRQPSSLAFDVVMDRVGDRDFVVNRDSNTVSVLNASVGRATT
jgi:hypothetical protein